MREAYIYGYKRTATGGFLGSLKDVPATELGAIAIRAVMEGHDPGMVNAVYLGNVLSAGLGQSPARQAALRAGLPVQADCTTVNKVCASGMKSVMLATQQIQLGQSEVLIAGGMENMSRAPHYIQRRSVLKLGDDSLTDGLLKDGLTDAFHHFHMGFAAELCADRYQISREAQDAYALQSYQRAASAIEQGKFRNEIVPVQLRDGQNFDEDVAKLNPSKLPLLPPAFRDDGSITATNASNLNDGAAVLLLGSSDAGHDHQMKPLARVVAYADAALEPVNFTVAPSAAINKVLDIAGLALRDMDCIELNEAYAVVAIANQRLLGINGEKLNIYGGAVALGHPLGASGARILCTLLSALKQEGGRYGLAAICNGGGGASALIIENI